MSKEITVKTQAELDRVKLTFDGVIFIEGGTYYDRIVVKNNYPEARVVAWENSSVVARGNSSVVARGNSSVVAWENSSVVARGNSSVVARGNSSVEAWGNSSVEAWGNSSVEAWGNSSVVAWGNSSVVAWGNSSVEAWGNSSVVAWGNVGVHAFSAYSTITLFAFAVCWLVAKAKVIKKSKTATIITPKIEKGLSAWFEREGIEEKSKVILFKKVSKDFKTQERTQNETLWTVGSTLDHPNWNPKEQECGPGKFHACSHAYFCDEFRSERGDRYIAIEIAKKDLYVWDNGDYPHKIAFKKGKVLFEVNKMGNKI